MARLRVGVDIGGTFTDFAVLDEASGEIKALKFPSDRARPASSVFDGLTEALGAGRASGDDIIYFSHGTTLAVNTILEYNGARTALLITKGLRDILHIGRHRLPDIFNFFTEMPNPLVRRANVIEVPERCLADGTVAVPVDRTMMTEVVSKMRLMEVEAVAIGFLHSYRNPKNEEEAHRLLSELAPDLYVSTSSSVWPQMREFERTLAGAMNAYVGRRMQAYFSDLEEGLRTKFRVRVPVLSTKSNGGVMTAAEAANRPTETLMSGPAAGAMGAAFVAKAAGFERLVTIDIGGTSTDVAIIDGEPRYSTENQVGNFPVIMPAVDVTSIGAGGGSIAWIDNFGVLKVGPRSAGARPGPAAYGWGGIEPTLTDAFVALGVIAGGDFAAGRINIRQDLAREAISRLATRMDRTVEEAAEAIIQIATSHIYATLVPLLARKGIDYSQYALLPFGGAGPMHGLLVAREIGIPKVIVPLHPGVLCATGALVADVRRDFVRTVHRRLIHADAVQVVHEMLDAFSKLEQQGNEWLDDQGLTYVERRFRRLADMRYHGQSFEISVSLDEVDLRDGPPALVAAFEQEYERIYGYANSGAVLEVRDVRVVAIGQTVKPKIERLPQKSDELRLEDVAVQRPIFHDGQFQTAWFVDRTHLASGNRLHGPAVITQYDTTTFVPAGYVVTADVYGNLIAETSDAD